jgi:hypothetical protein
LSGAYVAGATPPPDKSAAQGLSTTSQPPWNSCTS